MSLRKLTAGDGYTYLTRQVAAHDSTEKGHRSLADYYAEKGESPGAWVGAGLAGLGMSVGEPVTEEQMWSLFGLGEHPNAAALRAAVASSGGSASEVEAAGLLGRPFQVFTGSSVFRVRVARAFTAYNRDRGKRWNAAVPVEDRARIRTGIGRAMFAEQHAREPLDARELSGFIARESRQATSAVAGFDLTFSPVKSVSALWALAPPEVAETIRAAHQAAVADTLAWLEREVAHTRVGRGGARQVPVRGLVAAAFTHRDSRAGDPDLHTHLAISNKVEIEDGRWLSLDGRVLYAAKVAASEHYNTRLEAELVARLGVEFAERHGPEGRRPVREIRGVSTALTRSWSQRRADIEARQADLAREFQTRHGRPPTVVEAKALADQATLETRPAKHDPRSEAEQRTAWRAEGATVLGGESEVDEMRSRALTRGHEGVALAREWVEDAAVATIAGVEASRATWNVWHLQAEAARQARGAGIGRDDQDHAVSLVVDAALSRCVRLGDPDPITEPAQLRRPDGASVYDVHGATHYTSARVLDAERGLLAAASRNGSRATSDVRVEVALEQSKATGVELNDAQATMVRDLATSGAAVQLALAPAGTGKTTTMSVLADAWAGSGGQVVGLAPSAQAAHELGSSITGHTDTLAKLTWTLAHQAPDQWPRWIRHIGPSTMVIIDEAGQAATTELAAAVGYVTRRGGVVRLVGDDQQLAAVAAGGVLRDIQHQYGAATLTEVRRFHDPAEAAATLAVRDGDASALGFYADNGRIHVGDLATVADRAYDAWAADRRAGLDTVLLAPTRELVTQLNTRARADRLTDVPARERGAEVALGDGTRASTGDVVVTRRNDRRLTLSRSNWVKNGDRWQIQRVLHDGRIRVRHLELDRSLVLPADYVGEHVQLGYACTVHGAQGTTTDTAHLVAIGEEARQILYVGLSRGRTANHVYLATGHDGDPHSLIEPDALRPPTAIDVLTRILDRDGSDRSATTTRREADAPATRLHQAVLRYQDALGFAAEQTLGDTVMQRTEAEVEAIWPGLTREPAYPTLRAHLALNAVDGHDPIGTLLDAAAGRELDTSQDRTAVLDWRLQAHHDGGGPLPWLDAVPARLAGQPEWGPYLTQRAQQVTDFADDVARQARDWPPSAAPGWAAGLTAPEHADLRADVAVWRAAFAVLDTEPRPSGPTQLGSTAAGRQRALDRRVRAVLGSHRPDRRILDLLPQGVHDDEHFDRLGDRLAALDAAHVDVAALLNRALAEPQPLPDERASDALWWRLVRHLGPAALRASATHGHSLRPAWSTHLARCLGEATATRVMADAMWPALVAAVHARPAAWTPEQLLDAATSGCGPVVPAEDLCSALVWRIATMTDPPENLEEPPEPDLTALDRPVRDPALSAEPAEAVVTTAERILELNQLALDHYVGQYSRSWAPVYLRVRLGTDLGDEPRFTVGYAPPGPTSLIRHLTARGASTDELVDAGLARITDTGRLVDAFRDRVVFPIRSGDSVVGFIGRRNPRKDDHQFAGPKYLNTRGTAVFTKGEQLFGLAETAGDLDAGAVPVLVEGALDAIAVAIATDGAYVGIAPLGTALTEAQALQVQPYLRDDPTRLIIATDPDPAGWHAARRAFVRAAALRANPRHLAMPNGVDPADVLRTEGAEQLTVRLTEASGLVQAQIDRALGEDLESSDVAARIYLGRDLARLIGALPPAEWPSYTTQLADRLDLPIATLQEEVHEAGTAWTNDPHASAERELARLRSAVTARENTGERRRARRVEAPGLGADDDYSVAPTTTRRPSPPRSRGIA